MLNTGPLGGQGVPLFCIVSWFIVEKHICEWCFVSITEDDEDFVLGIQVIVTKGNSIVSSHSFVCAFYK
jgi:hypothetical protein